MERSNYRVIVLDFIRHVIPYYSILYYTCCCSEDACMLLVDAEMRAVLLIGIEGTSLGED